jgi:hypothetical protein
MTLSGGTPQLISGIKVYLDGTQVDDDDLVLGTYAGMRNTTSVVAPWRIGTDGATEAFFVGDYYLALIIDDELSATEMKEISDRLCAWAGTLWS